jgi:hypothetical protein
MVREMSTGSASISTISPTYSRAHLVGRAVIRAPAASVPSDEVTGFGFLFSPSCGLARRKNGRPCPFLQMAGAHGSAILEGGSNERQCRMIER